MDDINNPRTQKSQSKASHPDQVKNSKKGKRTPRACDNATVPNDPPLDPDTQDEDILITDEYVIEDDREYTVAPDEIGFYTFFLEGQGNLPDLMGIEDVQLLVSWPENQGILFFYISKTLEMIRISFMASLLNAVL